ncbi:hypothetical protein OL229_09995 [Neisseriaceae bacterium JH1-16]|nr:hypothetical protein [Neisseriaceae bacterium JH1-16]
MKTPSQLSVFALTLGGALLLSACGGGGGGSGGYSSSIPGKPANGGSTGSTGSNGGSAGNTGSNSGSSGQPGGSGNGGVDIPSLPSSMTISGRAIDGYLQGAKVCVDLNDNGECDPGDPSTTTSANGSYSLTVDPQQAWGKKMLAEIGPNTVDISSGGHFPTSFILATVIEDPTTPIHITPITTLVTAKRIEGWSKTAAEMAVQQVARASGANPGNLYDDYLANGDTATANLASAIVSKLTNATLAGASTIDLASQRAIASAIVDSGTLSSVNASSVAIAKSRPVFTINLSASNTLGSPLYSYFGLTGSQAPVRTLAQLAANQYSVNRQTYVSGNWGSTAPGDYDNTQGGYTLQNNGSWSSFIAAANLVQPYGVHSVINNRVLVTDPNSGIKLTFELGVSNALATPVGYQGIGGYLLRNKFAGVGAVTAVTDAIGSGGPLYVTNPLAASDRLVLPSPSNCPGNGTIPVATITEDGVTHCNNLASMPPPAAAYTSVSQILGQPFSVGDQGTNLVLNRNGKGTLSGGPSHAYSIPVSWSTYPRNSNVLVVSIPLTDQSAIGDLYDADLLRQGGKVIVALHNGHLKRGQLQPAATIGQEYALADGSRFDLLFAAIQSVADTL